MNQSCEVSYDSPSLTQEPDQPRARWSAVFALSFCAFAMVASEFLPVSLLTLMAVDLSVSEGAVGLGISISGLFALLTALSISSLAGALDRRALLLGLTVVMVTSTLILGFAPNYATYMFGRVLVGIALGGFWSLSAAAAARLVPIDQVPKALAIFNAGNALAMVVAAPLGSYLGSIVGWRGAFLFLAPVTILILLWQSQTLPVMKTQTRSRKLLAIFKHLKSPMIFLGYTAITLFFAGQFALFTYIRAFLERATGVTPEWLSLILLLMGVFGFIGTTVINRVLQANFVLTLILMPLVLALTAMLLIGFGERLYPVTALLCLWGFVATAAPVGWWAWVTRAMSHDAEAGGGLMVAFVQLAIGLGSTLGGFVFDLYGYQSAFILSAALLVSASLTVLLTSAAPDSNN